MQEATGAPYLSVRAFSRALWADKSVGVAVTCAFTAAALLYAFLTPEIFRAEALVEARQDPGRLQGLGAVAAELSSIADLPSMGAPAGGERAVAIATLKSRALVQRFIEDY